MPFFESSTGVIINDSNFYNIGGDMTVHSTRLAEQDSLEGFPALEFGASLRSGHQLEGPERSGPHPEAARTLTYVVTDTGPVPEIAGGSNNVYAPQTANHPHPWSMSALNASLPSPSNPLPHPSSQPPPPASIATAPAPLLLPSNSPQYSSSQLRPEFRFYPFGSDREYTSSSRDPGAIVHDTQAMLSNIQYSWINLEPWAGNSSEHANLSYPQDHPWPTFSHPPGPGMIGDGAQDGHNFYPGAPNKVTFVAGNHGRISLYSATHPSPGTVLKMGQNQHPRQYIRLHILHRVAACDAFHNSAERYPQPKCHPETRTKMLGYLWNWTCGIVDDDAQRISLMPGSAQIRSDLPTQSMADEGRSGQRNEPMAYEHLSSTCRHLPRSARSMLKTFVGCSYMPRSPSGSAWLTTVSIRRRRRAVVGSTDCVAYLRNAHRIDAQLVRRCQRTPKSKAIKHALGVAAASVAAAVILPCVGYSGGDANEGLELMVAITL
ncbi:hypothetical protein C8R44DRAFT_957740 [Mycena epipterygia]|nr:hypothetical protein C8R44DRAFT_957740 [Mycena epipterygia]